MNTNFFSGIARMGIKGDLNITIKSGVEGNLIVSVLLNNRGCGDDAKQVIPPLVLKGSAEDLDNGFFESISAPLQQTSQLCVNMEAYLKAQEDARKQSAMEKEKADKEKKEMESREKKYTEGMKKADELEKEGKHREAWMKVPDPAEYPEHEEAIRKRKSELAKQFAPDLFGAGATETATQEQYSFTLKFFKSCYWQHNWNGNSKCGTTDRT